MKRDTADTAFSNFIREKNNWTCQKCKKYYPEGHRQGLHCSHFFSRRHQSTRYYSKNATAHCFSCHQHLGGNPIEFSEWIRQHLGDADYEALIVRKNTICKRTKKEKKEIGKHWQSQLSYMIKRREQNKGYVPAEWD